MRRMVNVGLETQVERRLRIFSSVVLGCLIIILGRLWYPQIVRQGGCPWVMVTVCAS